MNKTQWLGGLALTVIAGGVWWQLSETKLEQEGAVAVVALRSNASESNQPVIDLSESQTHQSETVLLDSTASELETETFDEPVDLPRQLSTLTPMGYELNDYLREANIGYLDSSFYPFDAQTEGWLRKYANSGAMLVFDNTEAGSHLESYGKTSGDVVADFYGTGSPGDVIVATSVTLDNGGIEYMVLPISQKDEEDDLVAKVKLAVELFQEEKKKKNQQESESS